MSINKILEKAIPLWLVFVLLLQSTAIVALSEYYFLKKNFNQQIIALSKTTKSPEELVEILKQEVIPQKGYTLGVRWKDIGQQLLESKVIDKQKFEQLFASDPAKDQMKYLDNFSSDHVMINEKNGHFMVNALWALGLVNKSKVLDEGPMRGEGIETGNMASTGGWTLGSKDAMQLYSSTEIIKLTSAQQELVQKIAQNVYRPCCGNATAFPDCNHGMAALGYIELAVSQGVSEKQIYKDVLALNSFWFPQQYIELAAYMNKQGKEWKDVDSKLALSSQYSSAQGAAQVKQAVQNLPGFSNQSGGCGA